MPTDIDQWSFSAYNTDLDIQYMRQKLLPVMKKLPVSGGGEPTTGVEGLEP